MRRWTEEPGTLWAWEATHGVRPPYQAGTVVEFDEVGSAGAGELAVAMGMPVEELREQRLQGRRRCFVLRAGGQIANYGWVTHGPEGVGELERRFNLRDDEAYIWD